MSENVNQKREDFLRELTELSKKYGLVISGCGCCASPDISEQTIADDARYHVSKDGGFLEMRE